MSTVTVVIIIIFYHSWDIATKTPEIVALPSPVWFKGHAGTGLIDSSRASCEIQWQKNLESLGYAIVKTAFFDVHFSRHCEREGPKIADFTRYAPSMANLFTVCSCYNVRSRAIFFDLNWQCNFIVIYFRLASSKKRYDKRYALRSCKVIQGHRHWYQLKADIQFPIILFGVLSRFSHHFRDFMTFFAVFAHPNLLLSHLKWRSPVTTVLNLVSKTRPADGDNRMIPCPFVTQYWYSLVTDGRTDRRTRCS